MIRQKVRGPERMKQLGRKQIVLWVDRAEADVIEKAAAMEGAKVSTWCRHAVCIMAEKMVNPPKVKKGANNGKA